NGTRRIAPRQATAATAGRIRDSIGTPRAWCSVWAVSSPSTWRLPRITAPSRKMATNQTPGGSISRDRPTTVTAASARSRRPARPLDRQVQSMGRPVHLEDGAGPGGLGVYSVPVEVEVVAHPDHPARRMGDDVDVRTPDAVEGALGELGLRLAARDMDRGDD